jgi:hypothetical protein
MQKLNLKIMRLTNNETFKQLAWFCNRIGNEITSPDFPKQKFKIKNLEHAKRLVKIQKNYSVFYKDVEIKNDFLNI